MVPLIDLDFSFFRFSFFLEIPKVESKYIFIFASSIMSSFWGVQKKTAFIRIALYVLYFVVVEFTLEVL